MIAFSRIGRIALAAVFAAMLATAIALDRLPAFVAVLDAGMSLLTIALYARDKRAAARGAWRTPESTLHLLALLDGWPGALVAQQWFRHKSRKASFQLAFWATVALNLCALWWCARTTMH